MERVNTFVALSNVERVVVRRGPSATTHGLGVSKGATTTEEDDGDNDGDDDRGNDTGGQTGDGANR